MLVHITRSRSAFAPTHARPVIGADTGRLRYLRLHETPTGRRVTTHGVQNHRWTSLADAIDMQLVTVNSDQLTGGREFLPVVPSGTGLVYQAGDGQRGNQHEEP